MLYLLGLFGAPYPLCLHLGCAFIGVCAGVCASVYCVYWCPFEYGLPSMRSQGDPNVLGYGVWDYLAMVLVSLGYPVLLVSLGDSWGYSLVYGCK